MVQSKRVIEGFRLSPQQKHIWLLQETRDREPYRTQCEVRLEGDLDVPQLKAAVEDVVARYEILRTAFDFLPGMVLPLQVISGGRSLNWSTMDLRGMADAEQERMLESRLHDERGIALDLRRTPLISACLVTLDSRRHVLILTLPALCADDASLDLIVREISRSYGGCGKGEERQPASQYADLSEILNELVESPETETGRDYWRRLDVPALPETKLPLERASATDSFEPRVLDVPMAPGLAAAIETLAGQSGTSTANVCLASWLVLLRRLTGTPDSLIGVGSDGRTYEELREAPGLFAKYLPLRSSSPMGLPFVEFLGRVEQTVGELQQWQEFFSWEALGAVTGDMRGPLHPTFCFDFRGRHTVHSEAGVRFSMGRRYDCIDRFKAKLSCGPTGESFAAQLHYDGNRFGPADMERLSGYLQALWASIADDATRPIGELELLSDGQRRRLLVDFNDTDEDDAEGKSFVRLFEEQVQRTPQSPAVVFGDQRLTYADLNKRANQLAGYLGALGVGPEVRVAICIDRSIEMVVGLLGILKAGAAYVPLDPSYPTERLDFLLGDSRAPVLLTRGNIAEGLPSGGTRVVRVDADWQRVATHADTNPVQEPSPESLGYVIYTSGSTGQPKGVMVSHRALRNYVAWCTEEYGVGEGSGTVVHSSIGFDLTITSVFPPLLTGGTLFLVPEEDGIDGLGHALRRAENLSLVKITPSHLELLNQSLPADAAGGRTRALIIGGEALRYETLAFWRHRAPDTRLINEYGPTEATVGCCVYETARDAPLSGAVPIGRPIANTKLFVLDAYRRPVPLGVAGELHIGGDGLARGYLGRPDLTAERFVPNPFGPPSRLYRTGDLVRYGSDGNLEYLGRLDHQVKLRGFRIEPGEVEAALTGHRGVREAVILLREDVPGDKRLVAYVVPDSESPGVEELHSYLKEKLPEYMVPTVFVLLDALPLTPNGKLDRSALPRPEDWSLGETERVAPRNPTEEVLAGIWSDVLGVGDVGVNDDFFLRGGHSLLATQVIARVRQALEVDLPLRALFEAPTVAGLAERVVSARADRSIPPPPPVVPRPRDSELPLSFEQERFWFSDQLEPDDPSYNIFLALRMSGALDTEALQGALNGIAARHESLRTEFASRQGTPVQVISSSASLPIERVDLSGAAPENLEAEIAKAMETEAYRPFDLSRGPLIRIRLLRLADSENVLLLTMHHIVSDAWSCGILFRELALLYGKLAAGLPASLPALPVQYADYAMWQREYLRGEVLDRQLAYWRAVLSGAPSQVGLPVLPRTALRGKRGSLLRFALPVKVVEGVRRLAREEHATFFMTLLATFKAAIFVQTLQEDIVVGTDLGSRNRVEFEGLIGCFVNHLVLRTSLAGNPTFRDLLRRVREAALGAYAHQDLPFQKLVEQLQPKRSLGQTPLFQVLFVLQNAPMESLQLTGLTLTPMTLDGELAKFDLALFVEEKADGLAGTWVYMTDLFQSATVSDLSADFEMLLDIAVGSPDTRLDELPKLLAAKRSESIAVRRRSPGADKLRTPRGEFVGVRK